MMTILGIAENACLVALLHLAQTDVGYTRLKSKYHLLARRSTSAITWPTRTAIPRQLPFVMDALQAACPPRIARGCLSAAAAATLAYRPAGGPDWRALHPGASNTLDRGHASGAPEAASCEAA
jgi:hypothetical protein